MHKLIKRLNDIPHRSLKSNVIRFFYPHGQKRRVWLGPVSGARFLVSPGMGFTYAFGLYEGIRFLERKLKPNMTVFDIGANKGQMALFFGMNVKPPGQVYCFEPVPEIFGVLTQNIMMNKFSHIHPECIAISDRTGMADFQFSPDACTQGKLANVETTYSVEGSKGLLVQTSTLDDFVSSKNVKPDLIKIDAEGAGAAILRGARGVLASSSPAIFIELHGPEEQSGVKEFLSDNGYIVETLDGQKVADPTQHWYASLWCYRDSSLNGSS